MRRRKMWWIMANNARTESERRIVDFLQAEGRHVYITAGSKGPHRQQGQQYIRINTDSGGYSSGAGVYVSGRWLLKHGLPDIKRLLIERALAQ